MGLGDFATHKCDRTILAQLPAKMAMYLNFSGVDKLFRSIMIYPLECVIFMGTFGQMNGAGCFLPLFILQLDAFAPCGDHEFVLPLQKLLLSFQRQFLRFHHGGGIFWR